MREYFYIKRIFHMVALITCVVFLILITPNRANAGQPYDIPLQEEQNIRVNGNMVSLDLKDADIRKTLEVIAQKSKIEITFDQDITGKVTVSLKDATFEEALKTLCRSNALVYEYLPDKNAYRVIRALALDEGKEHKVREDVISGENLRHQDAIEGADSSRPTHRAGELLVRFKPYVTDEQIEDLHGSLGSTVIESIKQIRLQRIKLKEGLSKQDAINLYRASDIVEHVEKHALRYPMTMPDDPYFDKQWGLMNIEAPKAWDISRGSQSVITAIIDTGVDYTHPDLRDNIWINTRELNGLSGIDDDSNGYVDDVRGFNFAGADPDPMDVDGHGTHVAGIVGAVGNNSLGVAGTSWQIKIMPLKVQADGATSFDTFAIVKAVQYAIAKEAKIVVCSFGGKEASDNEENAFRKLKEAGTLAVCAAGNNGLDSDLANNKIYPASYDLDNIISVAACDKDGSLAAFSNYGLKSVDLMAPGADIYSTIPVGSATEALIMVGAANQVQYRAIGMLFAGMTDENGITGTLYSCGKGYPEDFPAEVARNIALIERGSRNETGFYFSDKVLNAQTAGAASVIIYNNVEDDFDLNGGTLGKRGDWIPAVSVSRQDGQALLGMENAVVTLINKAVANHYGFKRGTSMAAPHAAGLAGLILAQCPSYGYVDIKKAILTSVDETGDAAGKLLTGGRINAFAALKSILLPGDLNGDCKIGFEDAILAFRILTGLLPLQPYPCPSCLKPATGVDNIGLSDALFIMQKIAGFR